MLCAVSAWAQDTLEAQLETALLDQDTDRLVQLIATLEDPENPVLGRTPLLHHAVVSGDMAMVAALLDAGLSINAQGPNGDTALTLAVELERRQITGLLVQRGANRSLINRNGFMAYEIAAQRGENMLAFQLLPNIDRNIHANDWLLSAAAIGDTDAMRLARNGGADLDALTGGGETLLQVALSTQQWPTIEFLRDLPQWQRAGVLHEDDPQHLLEFALAHDKASLERRFAARVISTFLHNGLITPEQFIAAPSQEMDEWSMRLLMQDIGQNEWQLDGSFRRSIPELPELEFSLPMTAPTDGITEDHWRKIQRILRDEGLYSGPVDGIPGTGTFDGIYAYILGIAPLIVERGQHAYRLAEQGTPGYGQMRTSSRASPSGTYVRGRILTISSNTVATGYLALAYEESFDEVASYTYEFQSIPSYRPDDWQSQSVFAGRCEGGFVTTASATVLGVRFAIEMGDTHEIRYSGVDRYRNGRSVPGDPPRISC